MRGVESWFAALLLLSVTAFAGEPQGELIRIGDPRDEDRRVEAVYLDRDELLVFREDRYPLVWNGSQSRRMTRAEAEARFGWPTRVDFHWSPSEDFRRLGRTSLRRRQLRQLEFESWTSTGIRSFRTAAPLVFRQSADGSTVVGYEAASHHSEFGRVVIFAPRASVGQRWRVRHLDTVKLSPDGSRIVALGRDASIFDNAGELRFSVPRARDVEFSANPNTMLFELPESVAMARNEVTRELPLPNQTLVRGSAMTPDGSRAVVIAPASIFAFDLAPEVRLVSQVALPESTNATYRTVDVSDDGAFIAVGKLDVLRRARRDRENEEWNASVVRGFVELHQPGRANPIEVELDAFSVWNFESPTVNFVDAPGAGTGPDVLVTTPSSVFVWSPR